MYNYWEQMTLDVKEWIEGEYSTEELKEKLEDREQWESDLNDDLWVNDSITGNASGSYTFNRWTAQQYVIDNTDILKEALREFGTDAETIAEKFLDDEWEYFDVTIRCYLLGQAITAALDEIESEVE